MSDIKKKKIPLRQLLRTGWGPYLKLAKYITPYRWRFVMGMAAGWAFAGISSCLPLVLNYAGQKVFPGGGVSQKEMLQAATEGRGPQIDATIWIVALIPLIMAVRSLANYLSSYCMAWVSLRVLRDMRRDVFQHLINQSLDFFNRQKAGVLISRVVNDTRVAQNAMVAISGDIFKDPLMIIGVVIVLFTLDWKFCIVAVTLFPICLIPIVIFSRKVRQAGRDEENQAAAMTVVLQESFAGVRIIKSFAREDYQTGIFNKISEAQCQNSMRVRKSSDVVQPLIEVVGAVGVSLAIIYCFFADLKLVTLLSLAGGMFLLYEPVKRLSKIPLLLQKCITCATNIFDLLEIKATIQDAPNAVVLSRSRGEIEFRDVSFTYGTERMALRNVSLHIPAGKQYALVGASGAGKTTIMALLLRFYDPQTGTITLDDRDVRGLNQNSLRENIGIVTQEAFLFHDTIYENIRYGRLDATEAEIIAAAKLAHAHEFIMEKPEGYATMVGDKGSLLSGGQQQRLSIARALLKNAPILLLDEATSALDSESEKMIQDALQRLTEGRTVIAIAHRLSTVLKSDKIVVMDHGRIVETGTHRELLDKSPLYRNLYELQFLSHEEESPSENSVSLVP